MSARTLFAAALSLALALGCSSSSPNSNLGGEENETFAESNPVEPAHQPATHQAESPTEPTESDATGGLSVRFELDRNSIPADADTSNNTDARVEGRLFVRNRGTEARTVTFVPPAAYELTWTFTDGSGTVFEPVFLPPGMPQPGGRPSTTLALAAGEEAIVANLHSISGFFRQGEPIESWGPLPAGTYSVSVSEVGVDEERLTAPDVQLTAR